MMKLDRYIGFTPLKRPNGNCSGNDIIYILGYEKIFLLNNDNSLPNREELESIGMDLRDLVCIGENKGKTYFCKRMPEVDTYNEALNIRDFRNTLNEEEFLILSRALSLLFFMEENKRCGRCGDHMIYKKDENDIAMICSQCNHTVWPKVSPAIIVAVTKGDKILLGHNRNFKEGVYSVIAGFMELGESFEDTVRREVLEETNIKVKNIKYFGSQMWPFPNSYMVGFTAEYLDGDIRVDNEEILDARWFTKDELPSVYRESVSIASNLIEWFKNKS